MIETLKNKLTDDELNEVLDNLLHHFMMRTEMESFCRKAAERSKN